MPNIGIPRPLFYWKRPWASAHIFTDCSVFIKEWAGRDFKRYRSAGTPRQAARHTRGLCIGCWVRYVQDIRDR